MFSASSSGGLSIYWSGVIDNEDVRNEAMQAVFKHISELDEALENLYSILSVGVKGVVSYILY
jgi:glutathionyl-hydroquinone reductase